MSRTTRFYSGAVPLLLFICATAASAQTRSVTDSATFIVRLGVDTIGVEQWVRTANRIEAVSVGRSPRTTVRRYTAVLDTQGLAVQYAPGDSALRPVTPSGIPNAGGFYAPQALALAYAARMRDTVVAVPMLAGANVQRFNVRRVAPDAYELLNPGGAVTMRARLDRHGRLLWLESASGLTVERAAWQDIRAMEREFAARDARGQGLGILSPPDTVNVTTAGARISINYSQPRARGRTVFGGLVPYGRVWRTGANDATQFIVDRPVRVGDLFLAPGTYTLQTVPGRDHWHLIVNRRNAVAGAMQNAATQEVGRTLTTTRTLPDYHEHFKIVLTPEKNGATLRLQWENTEASVPIVVLEKR